MVNVRHEIRGRAGRDHLAVGELHRCWHARWYAIEQAPLRAVIAPVSKNVVERVVFEVEHHDMLDGRSLRPCRAGRRYREKPTESTTHERDHPQAGVKPPSARKHRCGLLPALPPRGAHGRKAAHQVPKASLKIVRRIGTTADATPVWPPDERLLHAERASDGSL